jgi:hypothetical protein
MQVLSDYQKEFLLEYFFKNKEYAGWRNIANKLLEKGQCIVAGKERIWLGGIGNFIKTEEAEDAVDCTLYKFDSEEFFTSEWYKSIRNSYIDILSIKKKDIDKEYKEINQLVNQ